MADPIPLSETLAEAHRTARRIMVRTVLWLVFELPALPFDRRNTPSLVFESEHVIRRVRNYPPDWRVLTDDELIALSWQR